MVESLQIGAHKYNIKRTNLGTNWGYVEPEHTRIVLSTVNVSKRRQMISLLHEAIHATLAEYGLNGFFNEASEELATQSLETGLSRLFIDNKQFSRELLKELLK